MQKPKTDLNPLCDNQRTQVVSLKLSHSIMNPCDSDPTKAFNYFSWKQNKFPCSYVSQQILNFAN